MISKQEKYRDIKERTFEFAIEIIKFAQSIDFRNEPLRTLGRQILRSGTSIGANMEEAQAGQSRADFISMCAIALKESRETVYWLRLLKEAGCIVIWKPSFRKPMRSRVSLAPSS